MGVFRTRRSTHDETRDELRRLGTAHIAFQVDNGWLVVGPTGLFVIGTADRDCATVANRLVVLARGLRNRLANELTLVPCVDALLVCDPPDDVELPCLTIGVGNLRSMIADGPRTVDADTLGRLGRLAFQRLA